ncbi:MAG TPA: hypothetical protein VHZ28_05445 [Terracidiphilus sp.]|jgi:hypothetical protein|nr:hypothetical protein [Terracidiphilus sp.]
MAQIEQMTTAPDISVALEAKNHRLQVLVGELLATNQELRFKVAQLKERAESAEQGLAHSCSAAGALWL